MRIIFATFLLLALAAPSASAATRTYSRAAAVTCDPGQLATNLDVALTRNGHQVEIDGLTVRVTHPQLTAADDATVNSTIAAYAYNPDWNTPSERLSLRGAVSTLRSWAQDARDEVSAWDGQTQAQKNAALKVLIQRLGVLLDRFADSLVADGLN